MAASDASPQESLQLIDQAAQAGFRRGLYPRWFAIAIAVWAGLLAGTVGSAWWLAVLAAGLIAHWAYKRRHGAWVREVHTRRDAWVVLGLGLVLGGVFVAGYVGLTEFDQPLAPWVAAVVVAAGVLAIMEISYRGVWRECEHGSEAQA